MNSVLGHESSRVKTERHAEGWTARSGYGAIVSGETEELAVLKLATVLDVLACHLRGDPVFEEMAVKQLGQETEIGEQQFNTVKESG